MPQRRSKYGATRTTVDNITFDSQKEARRYQELLLLQRAGQIQDLTLQPEFPLYAQRDFPLVPERDPLKLGVYRGDFQYVRTSNGEVIVEDVKGFKTPLYKWKRRHVEVQHGITIYET